MKLLRIEGDPATNMDLVQYEARLATLTGGPKDWKISATVIYSASSEPTVATQFTRDESIAVGVYGLKCVGDHGFINSACLWKDQVLRVFPFTHKREVYLLMTGDMDKDYVQEFIANFGIQPYEPEDSRVEVCLNVMPMTSSLN